MQDLILSIQIVLDCENVAATLLVVTYRCLFNRCLFTFYIFSASNEAFCMTSTSLSSRHYDLKHNDDIVSFFNDFSDHLAEEALWELSLKIKPRNITRRKTEREERT